jgi:hypothetical protein
MFGVREGARQALQGIAGSPNKTPSPDAAQDHVAQAIRLAPRLPRLYCRSLFAGLRAGRRGLSGSTLFLGGSA